MAKIAVLGHGVVGSGVCEVLKENSESISKRAGESIEVKRVLDLREFPELDYSDKFTKDYNDILNDDEISVIAEVMGGISPAYEYTKAALEKGKSVVTSNKELVAQKGAELLRIAKEHSANYFFEASVGGGIPIIRPMHICLAANEISEIAGILNGTTNFILTKMIKEQMTFETALKLAQDLGYAERNPAADVEGIDACRKICILASLAFGKEVHPDYVETKGITEITLEDVAYAESYDSVIKLIASAKKIENSEKIECTVSPAFVKKSSRLASIDDVYNGVLVKGNAIGDVVFYGKGAGKLPTASAVVGDIIDEVKADKTSNSLFWEEYEGNVVMPQEKCESKYYVRVNGENDTVVKQVINNFFNNVFILSRKDSPAGEIAFVTEYLSGTAVNQKICALKENDIEVKGVIKISEC